jgi:hypothetical protein
MVKKQIMTNKLSCCGIDVSHLTLDVTYQNNLGELFYLQVGNNNAGFKKLLEHTGQNCHFVMEATVLAPVVLFLVIVLKIRIRKFSVLFCQQVNLIYLSSQLLILCKFRCRFVNSFCLCRCVLENIL